MSYRRGVQPHDGTGQVENGAPAGAQDRVPTLHGMEVHTSKQYTNAHVWAVFACGSQLMHACMHACIQAEMKDVVQDVRNRGGGQASRCTRAYLDVGVGQETSEVRGKSPCPCCTESCQAQRCPKHQNHIATQDTQNGT